MTDQTHPRQTQANITSADNERDPILQAIRDYHHGVAEFQALPDEWSSPDEERAACNRTYGWALDVLENWTDPAETMEGAKAALAFARTEINDHGGSEAAFAMLNAAAGYLETTSWGRQ